VVLTEVSCGPPFGRFSRLTLRHVSLSRSDAPYSFIFQLLLRKIPGLIQLYRFILFCKQDVIFFAFKLQNAWFRKLVEKVVQN